MKKVFLISIIIYAFLYLGVSITNSTFNPLHWDKEGQLLVYVFGTLGSGWVLIEYKTIKSI
jgi:hypothetical protein